MSKAKKVRASKIQETRKFLVDLYFNALVAFVVSILSVTVALVAFVCPPVSFDLLGFVKQLLGTCYLRPFPTDFLPELLVLDSLLMPAVSALHSAARDSFDFLPKYVEQTPASVWRESIDDAYRQTLVNLWEWIWEPEKARGFFIRLRFYAQAGSMLVFFVAAVFALLGLAYTDPVLSSYAVRFSLALTVGGFSFTSVALALLVRRVSLEIAQNQRA